jgi:hypothetical protein
MRSELINRRSFFAFLSSATGLGLLAPAATATTLNSERARALANRAITSGSRVPLTYCTSHYCATAYCSETYCEKRHAGCGTDYCSTAFCSTDYCPATYHS